MTALQIPARRRRLHGIVVSDKMAKTVVVRVDRTKLNAKYKKRYTMSKKYKAHDEARQFHVGDQVMIEETRPISKDKRWRVVGKI